MEFGVSGADGGDREAWEDFGTEEVEKEPNSGLNFRLDGCVDVEREASPGGAFCGPNWLDAVGESVFGRRAPADSSELPFALSRENSIRVCDAPRAKGLGLSLWYELSILPESASKSRINDWNDSLGEGVRFGDGMKPSWLNFGVAGACNPTELAGDPFSEDAADPKGEGALDVAMGVLGVLKNEVRIRLLLFSTN